MKIDLHSNRPLMSSTSLGTYLSPYFFSGSATAEDYGLRAGDRGLVATARPGQHERHGAGRDQAVPVRHWDRRRRHPAACSCALHQASVRRRRHLT
ncbi:hypothetical protein PVAP13_5NG012633 [Panicum virgatum]|uniref:Uncharacterized protein n=1 Tax=Panicum virgatum TaxID=38727 RepID=A0A8T0SAT7_PANVG|nr:hypothetical protein PVAP13_5NG012633 [Panicum virgatum]